MFEITMVTHHLFVRVILNDSSNQLFAYTSIIAKRCYNTVNKCFHSRK